MLRYILKRLLYLIPVLLGITIMVFFIIRLIPGNPALVLLGQDANPEDIARITKNLGLDQNIFIQFYSYLRQLLRLDLGESIFRNEPVLQVIRNTFPASLELSLVSLIISLIISIPLGVIASLKRNTWFDYGGMIFAQLGISMPVFWTGMLLILFFSVYLRWFPTFGRNEPLFLGLKLIFTEGNFTSIFNSLKSITLPALTLGFMGSAMISRMIRSTMLEVLDKDYIRTARAKGLSERVVVIKHAARNAIIPVITIVGLQFGRLLGGAIVTETVFAWPGMGRLLINGIAQRDFPVVQGGVLVFAFSVAFVNLLVDLTYSYINPRIKNQ